MFGYPTGVGALIARKSAVEKLHRPWYSGGTITFSSVVGFGHYLTPGSASFEDGTVNYLSIPAVEIGLKWIESIGIDVIHTRVDCLTGWLIEQLAALRHSSGAPVVASTGRQIRRCAAEPSSSTSSTPTGRMFDCYTVEQMANERRISLRAGCHCNPGAREQALGFTQEELEPCFCDADRLSYEQFLHVIDGKTTGALRASLGLATTFADVYQYVEFARRSSIGDDCESPVRNQVETWPASSHGEAPSLAYRPEMK